MKPKDWQKSLRDFVNKTILHKAIEKAMGNGFTGKVPKHMRTPENILANYFNLPAAFIFSHDFAKAFFGEHQITTADIGSNKKSFIGSMALGVAWQYHLQQMVLEEDPIQYLEKFL